ASLLVKKMPPMMCTSHGGDILGLNGGPLNRLKRWTIRRTQMLTIVSHAMRDQALALGIAPEALAVIPMGVDTETMFAPRPDVRRTELALLFVGRLVEKKGAAYLLVALPMILARYPEVRLDIVGSGAEESSLRDLVENLGIGHAVHFHGALDNAAIPAFCLRASMLIMPSLTTVQGDQEGLGLVLVEALACECPVIASSLPAIRDVVIHQRTGWLVPERNAIAIADAVIKLLGNPGLRRNLAVEGRSHVKANFDWIGVAARYGALIQALSQSPAYHE
ncbi:MAG TPA: glycosyltransferase, partial [Novimethylophilus sp.]|uniref:glycosyltransferase n=1 Tax=Novimethylophilus sp. TaxID=2137426 RepID=UPI002F3EE400